MTLVLFPRFGGRTLVLIFRKISELHGKKYPISDMHLAQFPQIVGITKEWIRAIIWEMLSKKGDQHFGTVSMTKYNVD